MFFNHDRITCQDRNCQHRTSNKFKSQSLLKNNTWQQLGVCQKTCERLSAWCKRFCGLMKQNSKHFSWCKVLCLLELGRAYQPSNTVHTSKRDGAASDLAREDRETLPEVQRNNEGSKHRQISRRACFRVPKAWEWGPTNFSSNRTQTCCQVNAGVASQQECQSPSAASKPRFESQRKSVEWLEDRVISAKSKCVELMQMFPKRVEEELLLQPHTWITTKLH